MSSDYANIPVYQKLPTRSEYFTSADEKIFINLRRGKGYTNEIEKLNRADSDLKKNEAARNWLLPRQVLILHGKGGTHYELQKVRSKQQKHASS